MKTDPKTEGRGLRLGDRRSQVAGTNDRSFWGGRWPELTAAAFGDRAQEKNS
jgi:hypothetical protein